MNGGMNDQIHHFVPNLRLCDMCGMTAGTTNQLSSSPSLTDIDLPSLPRESWFLGAGILEEDHA